MADLIFNAALIIACVSVGLAFVRFLLGPTLADRTVALDGMTIMALSVIAWISVHADRIIYLDVALVYGLISFIGIIAFARYKEGGLS
ncbi:cation:proton antiporter [bacterium]|nr:cation:proton antiporter [bacterium]